MLKGKAIKFGANINTDDVIPARYLNLDKAPDLAKHLFEDFDPAFLKKARKGDIIVATSNFGCGSSREHAPLGLKGYGISAVIADNFARIFFRNSINIGLPLIECPECVAGIKEGNTIEIDLDNGVIKNVTSGKTFKANKYPTFMSELIAAGGLIEYTKKRLAGGKK